ncbi:MAG: hypothetical protein CV087_06855 [Candidatus Brocadia sp. WS118]|nr:MAG: hypothetical protein CV087_06855 [Candidatus Brocadia sp. WS118]
MNNWIKNYIKRKVRGVIMKKSVKDVRKAIEESAIDCGLKLLNTVEVERLLRLSDPDVKAYFAYMKHLKEIGEEVFFSDPPRPGYLVTCYHIISDDTKSNNFKQSSDADMAINFKMIYLNRHEKKEMWVKMIPPIYIGKVRSKNEPL